MQMNEVQAQVVPADLDGDGRLELVAADAVGSVAAWRGVCVQWPVLAVCPRVTNSGSCVEKKQNTLSNFGFHLFSPGARMNFECLQSDCK